MNVLIAGANGTTGRLLIEQIAKEGEHRAIAMVRDPKQEPELEKLGAQTVVGDLEGDVSHAVHLADAIIFAAGSGSKTGPDKTISVDQEGAKNLIDEAKKHGIKHFVMLSSMGTDNPTAGPSDMEQYFMAKAIADEYLRGSDLSYTIVRPGALTDERGTGKIEAADKINQNEGRSIPREDVAAVLIAALTKDELKNKTFEILSGETEIDEALSKVYA
ncbi:MULTISPECIES: SDR family oxidoreductase [Metabacillus]|uniref:NAD-dependent dehydratase n=1 Tax=Metabacillus indicus TaxID=246786 RepID=A0A084H2V0_METID|nr:MULTISPECIES: SDR family oxidoreductase [Metabacillus]KEZ52700.1 NAD-dependent dehydratase [Metabacillus indicus LMG 22858]KEZ53912.1 NAD-dependent dehydratase [Metabacillus indicus]